MTISQTLTAPGTAPAHTQSKAVFNANIEADLTHRATHISELTTWQSQANALAAAMNAIAAGGAMTIPYTFSTTTTDADPGNGILRLDNATQNIATVIRADLLGSEGSTWTDVLNTFDDSDSTIKGFILLQKASDATKWLLFSVSSLASPSGYKNITVVNVASSAASPFANADALVLKFTRNGDKGATGAAGGPTLGTPVDSTSGTSIDFTGIAAGKKRITINFNGVSTSGTDDILIQLGDAGGFETSGYISTSDRSGTGVSSTAGFILNIGGTTNTEQGSVILSLLNSSTFLWCGQGNVSESNGATIHMGGGKALSAELTQIRITTVGGSDTFDAGSINIITE